MHVGSGIQGVCVAELVVTAGGVGVVALDSVYRQQWCLGDDECARSRVHTRATSCEDERAKEKGKAKSIRVKGLSEAYTYVHARMSVCVMHLL